MNRGYSPEDELPSDYFTIITDSGDYYQPIPQQDTRGMEASGMGGSMANRGPHSLDYNSLPQHAPQPPPQSYPDYRPPQPQQPVISPPACHIVFEHVKTCAFCYQFYRSHFSRKEKRRCRDCSRLFYLIIIICLVIIAYSCLVKMIKK
jgi:hypothetical protein